MVTIYVVIDRDDNAPLKAYTDAQQAHAEALALCRLNDRQRMGDLNRYYVRELELVAG